MKRIRTFTAALALALLAACAKPLPADKADYAGAWSAPNMNLIINRDGTVGYKRVEGNRSTTINAPINGFSGASFSVGVGPFATTFVVSAIPHPEAGVWKMTVDGVELTRHGPAPAEPSGAGLTVRF